MPVKSHGHTINRTLSPTYRSWWNMVARCTYPSAPNYAHYKKRGVELCDRWLIFANFLADVGPRPDGTTLERIDNCGHYEPRNCRWATRLEQANNRITNIHFDYRGTRYTLAELARHTGVSKEILRHRLVRCRNKWTVEGAVHTPIMPKGTRYHC